MKPKSSLLIDRIEVIGDSGRLFTKYLDLMSHVEVSMQDGGKTMKIFLTSTSEPGMAKHLPLT
jgi:hypothetical protein